MNRFPLYLFALVTLGLLIADLFVLFLDEPVVGWILFGIVVLDAIILALMLLWKPKHRPEVKVDDEPEVAPKRAKFVTSMTGPDELDESEYPDFLRMRA